MDRPVRTIDREELSKKLAAHDSFKLIMALNEWAFRAKHIPGSLHFNTEQEMLANLKKDDDIIVYCSTLKCHSSVALYFFLLDTGFTNVRRYAAGLADWEDAGLPLEGEWIKP